MSSAPERAGAQQLAIVEKYERFIEYIYPIVQNIPRKHGVARNKVLHALFDQVDLFIIAGKSNQASRLYSADANLALMRFWLRFLASSTRKITRYRATGDDERLQKFLSAWLGHARWADVHHLLKTLELERSR